MFSYFNLNLVSCFIICICIFIFLYWYFLFMGLDVTGEENPEVSSSHPRLSLCLHSPHQHTQVSANSYQQNIITGTLRTLLYFYKC